MPDISMCFGMGCPVKETCYRYRAKPSGYQAYFTQPPYIGKERCDYYWGDMNESKLNELFKIVKDEPRKKNRTNAIHGVPKTK